MNYGNDEIFKCPKCGHQVKNKTLSSSNTFNSVLYSDGYLDAPMKPEFPKITKCAVCSEFYWLDKQNFVKGILWLSDRSMSYVDFLKPNEYIEAEKICVVNDEKIFLRERAWWSMNRKHLNVSEQKLYADNCTVLLRLLNDRGDVDAKIKIAELYRNLGEFEKCADTCNAIIDSYLWIKEQFLVACANKNRKVIALKLPVCF